MYNIFICYTPFHLNMAYSVIVHESLTQTCLIYLPKFWNTKSQFYFDLAKNYFDMAFKFVIKKSYLNDYFQLKKIAKSCPENGHVYIGNPKTMYSRFLLSNLNYNDWTLFDDGIGHFLKKSYYFSSLKESKISHIYFKFFNSNHLYKNLKSAYTKHYSLFDKFNSYDNSNRIKIKYQSLCPDLQEHKQDIDLLVTSCLSENGLLDPETEKKYYHQIIQSENLSHVLLHPLENKNKTSLAPLSTELIAEDLVAQGSISKIAGIMSTSLITAKLIQKKVECVNYYYKGSNPKLLELFNSLCIKNIQLK